MSALLNDSDIFWGGGGGAPALLSDDDVFTSPKPAARPSLLSDDDLFGAEDKSVPFGSVARGWNRLQQAANVLLSETGLISQDDAARAIVRDEADIARYPVPPSTASGLKDISEAKSWGGTAYAILTNPSAVASIIGESVPASVVQQAIGAAGLRLGGAGGMMGGSGIASFATEYASTMLDTLRDEGVDIADPAALEKALTDDGLMAKARERGVKRGIPIALFDAISFGMAGKFTKAASGGSVARQATGLATEAGTQAGFGMAGEAGAQFADKGQITSPGDVMLEGAAEVVTSVPEVGIGVARRGEAAPILDGRGLPQGAAPAETLFGAEPPALTEAPAPPQLRPSAPTPPSVTPAETTPRLEPTPEPKIALPAPEATAAPTVDVERADSPRLTPEDRASPIPNDLIDDGKAMIEAATTGKDQPSPASGMVRYYHGTTFGDASTFTGKTFLSPEESYARNYGAGNRNVLYADFTKDEAIARGLWDEQNDFAINGAITDGSAVLKPLGQGLLPDGNVFALPRRDISTDIAVTSSGREVPVTYAVVEASSLVPSQRDGGGSNPDYPAELQPRDRSRGVSSAQISDIAQKLNPRLLDMSPRASDGAPIVAPDGVVESGNGRVLAIRQAYAQGLDTARAYREHLAAQGYPVEGMAEPVLVRVRDGEMTPDDRMAFTREANERDTLGMSATERAMADAQAMTPQMLALYRGGEVDEAGNREFVRSFMQGVVSANDRAGMIDQSGALSQEAIRRVRASLLAKAYGDADLVGALVESADTSIKAIGGALMDVASEWAQMRSEAQAGSISAEVDQTGRLLEAVRLVERARRDGQKLVDLVGQRDIFSGQAINPVAEAFLRLMFRNQVSWTMPAGRDRLADALRFYVTEARKTSAGADLLGETAPGPEAILGLAKERQYGAEQTRQQAFALRPAAASDPREDVRPSGQDRAVEPQPGKPAQGGPQGARTGDRPAGEVVGPSIDGDWTRFNAASGTLGIPRSEMPQIKAKHRGALVNFLNARGIAHEERTVLASDLKPTQAEFSRKKVDKAKGFTDGDRSILVSNDGHVLDGHHQWLAKRDEGGAIGVIRLDAPIRDLLGEVKEFPSATQAKGATAADQAPAMRTRAGETSTPPPGAGKGAYLIRESAGGVDTELMLSEAFVEKADELARALRKSLDQMGLKDVAVRVSESIRAIINGQSFAADGRYLKGVIDVALDAPDPTSTLDHEAIHAMRRLGLFTDTEWSILSRKSDKEWRDRYDIDTSYAAFPAWARTEEGIAHAYADWARGARMDGVIARSFKRIKAFMKALAQALTGLDFRSAGDVFSTIDRGEIGARERPGRKGGGANFGFKSETVDTLDGPREQLVIPGAEKASDRQLAERKMQGRMQPSKPQRDASGLPLFGDEKDQMSLFQAAWHGSPHQFDKFSLEHIGTGEGAQAYGWGLYFASKREVSEWYRNKLAGQTEILLAGEPVDAIVPLEEIGEDGVPVLLAKMRPLLKWPDGATRLNGAPLPENFFSGNLGWLSAALTHELKHVAWEANTKDISTILVERRKRLSEDLAKQTDDRDRGDFLVHLAVLDAIEQTGIERRKPGRLYKVEVPDDSELLDWDKPLSDQTPGIKAALKTLGFEPKAKVTAVGDPVVARIVAAALKQNDGDPDGLALIIDNDQALYKAAVSHAKSQGKADVEEDGPGAYIEDVARDYLDGLRGRSTQTGWRIYAELSSRLGRDVETRGDGWGNTGPLGNTIAREPNPQAASQALAAAGIPGHRYKGHESDSTNYVIYDDSRVQIEEMFKLRKAPHTAEEAQQVAQGFIARGQLLDRAIRVPFDILGGLDERGQWKPGKRLTDKIGPGGMQGAGLGGIVGAGIGTAIAGPVGTVAGAAAGGTVGAYLLGGKINTTGRMRWLHGFAENARRGLIDRYGLDPEYIAADRARATNQRGVLQKAQDILQVLSNASVGPEEAKVLQAVLTGENVDDEAMKRLALPIRQAIDDLGQEAVSLGLISAESFERNRGAYLHRVYLKNEVDQGTLAGWVSRKMTSRRTRIIGDQMKGRGLFWDVPLSRLMQDVPGWAEGRVGRPANGDKFRVLDRVEEQGDMLSGEAKGRTAQRVYLPAGKPVPDQYQGEGWKDRGTWEVRKTGDAVTLWRDYTKDERARMGEILDARYTIGRTFMLMANDLSAGRFYKEVAENENWARSDPPATGWRTAEEYSERGGRYWTDPEIAWVKVPETVISNTGGKKRWGALAGKYVRAEIWRDLNETQIAMTPGTWRKLLTQWKLNKTARNPVVHMNNIMSNMMFMDLADVRMQDLVSGVRELYRQGDEFKAARDNGAFGQDMMSQEIRDNVLKPILEQIAKQEQGGTANSFLARAGKLGRMADVLWTWAKTVDRKMIQAYQAEDEIFRMATYLRRRSLGESPEAAAQNARDQFLNYDIKAPWVNAARSTVIPFAAYTYRAVPKLAENIAHRPWKMAKYFAIAYAVNALAYGWGDGDDGEDRERASLRDEEQGWTWLGVPRMMRMPFRDADGLPVFLDVRRWVPSGDIFDTTQGQAAFPIPAPIQFGGPIMLAAEFLLNRQAFTGDDITNDLTDDNADKAENVADWLWKAWMPSAFWMPNSWYWDKIANAATGATDAQGRDYSLAQALLSSIGIKVRSQDVENGLYWHNVDFKKVNTALRTEMRRLGRQRERNLISQAEYDRAAARISAKFSTLQRNVEDFQRRSQPVAK